MKIITAFFNFFRNGEFLQFIKNVLNIVNRFDLAALNLADRVSSLTKLTSALDAVFKPIRGQELTAELQKLDTRRDRALQGIKQYLQSHLYREEEEMVAAAELLLENYESHGKRIDKMPYQQETVVTAAMLDTWLTDPRLSSALSLLSLTGWVNLLKGINETFDEKYVERAKISPEPALVREKREAIREEYQELQADIEANARISKNKQEYEPIIKEINSLIEDYNQVVNNRLRGKSDEDADTKETGGESGD